MLYVISYDVSDDHRRRRVCEALKDYGRRVQYSVFERDLDEPGLMELMERIDFDLDRETDSLRAYRLCGGCVAEVRVVGRGERYTDRGFYVV